MKWFKHMTNSHNDEILSELIDEFGPAGYGVWWIILEVIATHMDDTDRTSAKYSIKKWSNFCGISPKKFQKIVEFLKNRGRILVKKEENYLILDVPNLLKYRDDYSRKRKKSTDKVRTNSGQTPDKVQKKSVECPAQEEEVDKDIDIYKAGGPNNNVIHIYRVYKDKNHASQPAEYINFDKRPSDGLLNWFKQKFLTEFHMELPNRAVDILSSMLARDSDMIIREYGNYKIFLTVALKRMHDIASRKRIPDPDRFLLAGLFGKQRYLWEMTPEEEEKGSYVKPLLQEWDRVVSEKIESNV